MRILLVEDDKDLCQALLIHFKDQGYDTDICNNGTDGLFYALQNVYDLIILDRMLPELDGLTLLNTIRKRGIQTPVILATAMDSLDDKIHGLDEGADDYITKPFAPEELLARLPAGLCGQISLLTLKNWNFPVEKTPSLFPKKRQALWNIL